EITPGEPIQIGSVTIIVQRRHAATRRRRLWTHDYFEVRLEEECERAYRRGETFALLRVRCENLAFVLDTLAAIDRTSDVVAAYGPGDYEVLLADATPDEIAPILRVFAKELATHGEIGVACYPRDGSSPEVLMALAGRFGR